MKNSAFFSAGRFVGAILFLSLFSSCNGGGSGRTDFVLLETNLAQGSIWPINQPIEFIFSAPVDLGTVNASTVEILPLPQTTVGGTIAGPVVGTYYLKSYASTHLLFERVLVFQPTCPPATIDGSANSFFTGGGFEPANNFAPPTYRIQVLGANNTTGDTIRSQAGAKLEQGVSRTFTTPSRSAPFVDPLPTPISVVSGLTSFGSGGVLEMNLWSDAQEPLILTLDQPILPTSFDDDPSDGSVYMQFEDSIGSNTFADDNRVPATYTLLNCGENGTRVSIAPIGVLPPGYKVRLRIKNNLPDLSNSINQSDITAAQATVRSKATTQLDAIREEFDDTTYLDEENTESFLTRAIWDSGSLTAAAPLPGISSSPDVDVEISNAVTLDTDSGSLIGTNINTSIAQNVALDNGVLAVRDFTITATGTLTCIGSNPLTILADRNFTIEDGGRLIIKGADSPTSTAAGSEFTNTNANVPDPGGLGRAGGGDGGTASLETLISTNKGQDGFGSNNMAGGGGKGGHGAIGSTNPQEVRAGGGGGGNWGLDENNSTPAYECDSGATLAECRCVQAFDGDDLITDGKGSNLNGEAGTNGSAAGTFPAANDAYDGSTPPGGGEAGDAIFTDSDDDNDFYGFGVNTSSTFVLREGEIDSVRGGPGGGAGGNGIPAIGSFPPAAAYDFINSDFKGGSGGGGGGALLVRALGIVTIEGEIDADGGDGGGGQSLLGLDRIGGGGGGGAGGHVVLMSATRVALATTARIHAYGGDRGFGTVSDCPSQGNSRQDDAVGLGGAGGRGVIQIHVPRKTTGFLDTNAFFANSGFAYNDPTTPPEVLSNGDGFVCEPAAHLLTSDFGKYSQIRSGWFPTEWANVDTSGPFYRFPNSSSNCGLSGDPGAAVTLNSSVECDLGSSSSGLTITGTNTAVIVNASFYNAVVSAPGILVKDELVLGSNSYTIVSASVTATNTVTVSTDPDDGDLAAASSWTVLRKFFEIENEGNATVQVTFEGANEDGDGTGIVDESSIDTTTNTYKFIRFTVTFNLIGNGGSLSAETVRPSVNFLKIPYQF